MSEKTRPKESPPHPASEPWNSATTEPLPMPLAQLHDGAPHSPDSSGSLAAADSPKKIAEVKRSAEVESLLEGLSYPRPHVTMQRSETDGALFAAHSSGPRAVPAGAQTPTLEPALMLSQSLVEAISQPIAPAPVAGLVAGDEAERAMRATPRPATTTVVVARKTYRRLAIAFVPCAAIAVVAAWVIGRSTAAPGKSPVVVDPAAVLPPAPAAPPAPPPTVAPVAAPPVAREAPVAPAAPAVVSAAPVAAAPAPLPTPPSHARHPGGVARPSPGKPGHASPAPSSTNDSSSLHTDFEIPN